MRKAIFAIAIFLIAFFILTRKDEAPEEFINNSKTRLDEMSFEQKIGQVFMIGFEGKEMTSELEELVKETHPGAVLLLGKNIEDKEQLERLIGSLQKIAVEDTGLPLLVAVDQEGGPVFRISWVENTPQPEIETESQAYLIARQRAEELAGLGVNLNLAPLLDKLSENDFLYERGFVKDYEALGKAMVQGQEEGGIMSCVKHFPGYGNISFHPENSLAYVEKIPDFSQFKDTGAEMIMVSNVVYSELNEEAPFSFLEEGINILKNNIEGDYVIVSDDLSQYSLLDNFSLEETISRPFLAGVNMIIYSGWRSSVRDAVLELKRKAVVDSYLEKRINESVLKIIDLKSAKFNL